MSESWAPLVVLVALCSAAAGGAELPRAETAPGTVVRWPGDEIDSCQMEGRRWEAGEGACW
ncbi:MAG: hypothetical protein OEM62_08400, partial [Acidobacteriota bacterium]|nr:hypothetical protein [Acidobacteriota bacterium]